MSTSSRDASPQDHLTELLGRVASLAQAIREMTDAGEIESSAIWLHLDDPTSGLSLSKDVLEAIAELGSLEIDIYS